MSIMKKGQVSTVVPRCTCFLKEDYRNEDMVVFTVPRMPVRLALAFLGSMPYLGVAVFVYLVAGNLTPTAVANGSANPYVHYSILYTFFTAYIVMVSGIAMVRMHAERNYLLGGFMLCSILFGMVNLIRIVEEVIR